MITHTKSCGTVTLKQIEIVTKHEKFKLTQSQTKMQELNINIGKKKIYYYYFDKKYNKILF